MLLKKQSPGRILWKSVLKKFAKFTGNTCIPVSATLFNKFASLQPVTSLQKRNSDAISFPWILQNVWENIFKRINLGKSSVCHKRGKTVASIVVSKSEFVHLEILNIHSSTTHKKIKFIKTDCGSSSQWQSIGWIWYLEEQSSLR